MDIAIKKISDGNMAYEIAKNLSHYFNEHGLAEIKKAVVNEILFGAYIEDQMVGFITYKEINSEAIELSWMGVLIEYQGKGVGTQLVIESLKALSGGHQICEVKTLAETQPDEGYEKTRQFYKKLGFIPIEIIDPYPGWDKDSPCQILVKFLS